MTSRPRISLLEESPLARACTPLTNLEKKRDCSQSQSNIVRVLSPYCLCPLFIIKKQLHVSKWLFFQSKDRMSIEDPQQLSVNSRRSYIFSSDIVDRAYEN